MPITQAMHWLFIELPQITRHSIIGGHGEVLNEDCAKPGGVFVFAFRKKGAPFGPRENKMRFVRIRANPPALAFERQQCGAMSTAGQLKTGTSSPSCTA